MTTIDEAHKEALQMKESLALYEQKLEAAIAILYDNHVDQETIDTIVDEATEFYWGMGEVFNADALDAFEEAAEKEIANPDFFKQDEYEGTFINLISLYLWRINEITSPAHSILD